MTTPPALSVVDVEPLPERPVPPSCPSGQRGAAIRFGVTVAAAALLHLAVFAGILRHIDPLPSPDPIAAAAVVEIITVAAAPRSSAAPALQVDRPDENPVTVDDGGLIPTTGGSNAAQTASSEPSKPREDAATPQQETRLVAPSGAASPAPPLPPRRPPRIVRPSKSGMETAGAERAPASPVADLQSTSVDGASGAGQTVGEAAVESWRTQVRSRIVQAKRYPAAARARRDEGVVRVRITIAADGSLTTVDLVQSSGSDLLDGEGLAVMRRAAPYPPPPDGVSGSVVVPLSYRLRE